jgi:hypothetical protein
VVVTLGSPNWLNKLSEVSMMRSRVRRLGFLSMAVRVSGKHSIETHGEVGLRALQALATGSFIPR